MTRVKSLVIPLIFVIDPAGIYTVMFREKAILLGGKNPDKIYDPTRPSPLVPILSCCDSPPGVYHYL
jgi:hypothetical protein